MNIHLTAIIKSKPAFREQVKLVLQNMVRHTKKEEACLQYDLHQEIEDQNLFVFNEIWRDEAGLASHNAQPYIKEFKELASDKLQEEPKVYIITKI